MTMSKSSAAKWSFILFISACAGTDVGNPVTPEGVDFLRSDKQYLTSVEVLQATREQLQRDNQTFALALYRQLASSMPTDQNLFFSPYSISALMAMTYAGAAGRTAEQMESTMHFDLDPQTLHLAMNDLSQHFDRVSENSDLQLNMLNTIWLQKGFPVEQNYLDILSEQYDTGIYLADFKAETEDLRQRINQWIYKQTDQRIEELFPPESLSMNTALALTNSIYLSATWQDRFKREDTRTQPFTMANGDQVEVDMMSALFEFPCAITTDWRVAALPYLDTNISMMFILPNLDEFEQFEAGLDDEYLAQITDSLSECHSLRLFLPKFSIESHIALVEMLKDMGMNQPFNPIEANFSGISNQTPLSIYTAIHEAYVAVDEDGTVAGAATGEISVPSGTVQLFKFNRPFLFLIYDRDTRSILFMGRFIRPEGAVTGRIPIPSSDAEAICQIIDECGYNELPLDALPSPPMTKEECIESFSNDDEALVEQCAGCFQMEYEFADGYVSFSDDLCMGRKCADYCPTHPFGTGNDLFTTTNP